MPRNCADCGGNERSSWLCKDCLLKPENQDWVNASAAEIQLFNADQVDEYPRLADVIGKGSYELEAQIIEVAMIKHVKQIRLRGQKIRGGYRRVSVFAFSIAQIATIVREPVEVVKKILKRANIKRRLK